MKKIISILLVMIMLVTLLAGCGDDETTLPPVIPDDGSTSSSSSSSSSGQGNIVNTNTLPEGMTGEDLAKILLANERLNSHLLDTDGDIFEDGAEVFRNLAAMTRESMKSTVKSLGAVSLVNHRLAPTFMAEQIIEGDYIGKVTIVEEGDRVKYRWSDFDETNNSLGAFVSTTTSIINNAQNAADLIDYIKKNIRVVDKWIGDEQSKYLLHVEENSETLYQKLDDTIRICQRYKNEDGVDVYQMYEGFGEGSRIRMTYIPGLRYELTIEHAGFHDYFVADNSKGYWETYTVGKMTSHYNVSCFIMKDGLSYDSFYDPKSGEIVFLKVMSADKKTDIFNIQNFGSNTIFDIGGEEKTIYNASIDIKFSGFDGIKYVEMDTTPDRVKNGDADPDADESGKYDVFISSNVDYNIYHLASYGGPTLNLTNGKVIKAEEKYIDDKLRVETIRVGFTGIDGYIGELAVRIEADTEHEIYDVLKEFLDELGLECRRDLDETIDGIHIALDELKGFTKYYKWNGVCVKDEEGIGKAIEIETQRIEEIAALYLDVKDAEFISLNDAVKLELNMSFPSVTVNKIGTSSVSNMEFTIGEMSLTIDDTLLYVEDEPYHIEFALVDIEAKSGLVHLEVLNNTSVKYADEDKFTVNVKEATFVAPVLQPGNYTVVAYIATDNGVRSSAYTPVTFDTVGEEELGVEGISYKASKGENGECIISYIQIEDIYKDYVGDKVLDYASFYEIVAELTYEYGTPSTDLIEIGTVGEEETTYAALTGEETELASGIYRMKYTISNGVNSVSGYVYITFEAFVPPAPSPNPDDTTDTSTGDTSDTDTADSSDTSADAN